MSGRGRGRGSRMSSPHIDPELELGTKITGFQSCPVHPFFEAAKADHAL